MALRGESWRSISRRLPPSRYVPRLPADARGAVEALASNFSWILEKALFFEESCIPRRAWYYLFAGRSTALARKDCY